MTVGRLLAGLAGAAAVIGAAAPALAQQNIDEPRIDPIFGQKEADEPVEIEPMNDDEFDQPKGWSPLRGFVGVLTYLVPEKTNLSVGVGPEYRPDYFGSDDYEVVADPQVYVKFRNFVFLDNDGADLALFGFSGFAFGPSIRLVGDRDEEDNPELAGLDRIDRTLEVGGFAATRFANRVLVRFKVRKGVTGGHDGLIVDAAGTVLLFRNGRFSTSVSGNASWIGENYAETYFSISPEESVATGLPTFDADSGFRDVGGSVNAYVNLGKRWSLNPYVGYRRVKHDIAQAPIISILGDRNQFSAGFHLMREFQFDIM